jgi:hypothetical protein
MSKAFAILVLLLPIASLAAGEERQNFFDDPFVQVTGAMPSCPVPEGPLLTQAEFREAAHVRAQHGTSCHLSGRCRLANSYLYDKEIIPRVKQYIVRDGRFDNTSIWVLGQRRLVTLMGCVQTREQAEALEKSVLLVDDVMNVVNQLMVGTQGPPPYKPASAAQR